MTDELFTPIQKNAYHLAVFNKAGLNRIVQALEKWPAWQGARLYLKYKSHDGNLTKDDVKEILPILSMQPTAEMAELFVALEDGFGLRYDPFSGSAIDHSGE